MFSEDLKQLEIISQTAGKRPDYVQGGGGNTSVKLNGELMAVKASGFKLNQITSKEGYVVVNYKNIKSYYENVDLSQDVDFETESVEVVKKNIVEIEGLKKLRPSVEAGFHSILKKYVIHTHPVYANIICCSENGKEIADKIFKDKEYVTIWIPYINPGFCLTLKIKEAMEKCIENFGKLPQVIFMENHGLIIHSDNYKDALQLHDEVNDAIKRYLEIGEQYPEIRIEKLDDTTYKSNTEFLANFFEGRYIDTSYFEKYSLYPDQLVYLNGNVSINGLQNKLNVNTTTGELIYKTNFSEALTIEETLLGYLYVIDGIEKSELKIKTMSDRDIDFIKNWESEAYRKELNKMLLTK